MEVVILAAGKGTRMHSALPKVLHPIGGRPMLLRVLDTAVSLSPDAIHVVVGVGA
ncbi:MAG: bifunctional N-acetylglucosamine-1-phosphate uridyltransferase/glucosamine-1-phosphate acetyltransferase, partial [Gammaproteobacteria bacterium]|nr:bifunctional N-acetylglucosamine-1-phosphate uridyltransferase/glucosamine-1-phosphate acetyltransferase [Gammaproteobacteria bacterium]